RRAGGSRPLRWSRKKTHRRREADGVRPAGADAPPSRALRRLESLRIRILLLVLLVLVPALILIRISSEELRQARTADVERNALRVARTAAMEEDRLIEGAHQLLTALARLPQVWQARGDC